MSLEERIRARIGDYVPPQPEPPPEDRNPCGGGRPRIWLACPAEQARVWAMHESGLSTGQIGKALGVPGTAVLTWLRAQGVRKQRTRGARPRRGAS